MRGSNVKRGAFLGITGLTSAWLLVMLGFGLAFPVLAWLPEDVLFDLMDDIDPAALTHRLHELTVGVFSWALLLGVVLQFHKPERKVAPLVAALTVPIVLSVVELFSGNFVPADTLPLLVPILAVAFLHPSRSEFVRVGRFDPTLTGLTALASVPWAVFVLGQIRLQRVDVAGDVHAEAGHWGLMAGLGILVLVWGLIGASDRTGWPITGLMAALSSMFYGLHSLLFSGVASAASPGWAAAAVLWGVVYGAAVLRRSRVGIRASDPEPIRA